MWEYRMIRTMVMAQVAAIARAVIVKLIVIIRMEEQQQP